MKWKDLTIRYLIMLAGLFFLSFGIAVVAKAGLGTSPISSIPYSLSLIAPRFTLGNYVTVINVILVAAQVILLHGKPGEVLGRSGGKALPFTEVMMQFVLSVVMGYCVDFSSFLIRHIIPALYWQKLLMTLTGCCIMALGIYIQLTANVAMAPGDSFSRALSAITSQPYNRVRVIADASMVGIALILCLIFLHSPQGVREGTVICAFLTGTMIKVYQQLFDRIKKLLL